MRSKKFWKELENKVLHTRIDSIRESPTDYETQTGRPCIELTLSLEIFETGEFTDVTLIAAEDC
jgi:hypothetical protein